MKQFLIFIFFVCAVFVSFFIFPEGAMASMFSAALCLVFFVSIDKIFDSVSAEFLKRVFLLALLARVLLAVIIYIMQWEAIFGPDAVTFDTAGQVIVDYWSGLLPDNAPAVEKYASIVNSGWGMNYLVGAIYYIAGRNPLAIQFISCSLGAGTVLAIYYCTNRIFHNIRAAKYSALAIAFYPAMIVWSSQMLKDGIIVFLLAISIACVIHLHDKFNIFAVFILFGSLMGLLSMRFYIFYMVVAAIIGGFVVGAGKTSKSIGKRLAILLIIGIAAGYFGFSGNSADTLDTYANLDRIQTYRYYQAEGAGFSQEVDITTIEGTTTILPIGIVNILFAPFPWQMLNFRQAILLPEMLFWWGCIPFLISGLLYAIRNRLKPSISILTFSAMLTVAYAIVQSNIGAAYRQRTQIQVFLFIFIAVGWALYKERKENSDLRLKTRRKRLLSIK